MIELNPVRQRIADLKGRLRFAQGVSLTSTAKVERLEEVNRELENPEIWNDAERAQALGRERSSLEKVVDGIRELTDGLVGAAELLDLAEMRRRRGHRAGGGRRRRALRQATSRSSSSGACSPARWTRPTAFVDIQAGAGGTEAQDWAEILLRMYLRWCESRGWKTELMEVSGGEVAGIKSRHLPGRGRLRLRLAQDRDRRAPAGAQVAVRLRQPPPHQLHLGVRVAGSRRQHRHRHQPGRPAHRRLPLLRRRRPARQQDRVGGAHHPHADQHRGRLPDRPQPAPEPRQRDEDAGGQALRAGNPEAQRRARRGRSRPSPTSAGAARSATTCSTRAASRTCAPASSAATRRRCSTATWTNSSRPA